jgi:hypothetical protein
MERSKFDGWVQRDNEDGMKRRKERLKFGQPYACIVDQWELPRNHTERLELRLGHA